MKAKVIKDLLSKIPDDSEILFEYSCFIFGDCYGDKQPSIINKSELKEYEDDFGEDITDLCDFLISID
jgi:hypothetical protein